MNFPPDRIKAFRSVAELEKGKKSEFFKIKVSTALELVEDLEKRDNEILKAKVEGAKIVILNSIDKVTEDGKDITDSYAERRALEYLGLKSPD